MFVFLFGANYVGVIQYRITKVVEMIEEMEIRC